MPWQQVSPFQALVGTLGGFMTAQQAAKRQALEDARQADLDKQTAAMNASTIAYRQQQARASQEAADRANREDLVKGRLGGYDPATGVSTLKLPGMPKPGPSGKIPNADLASYYGQAALAAEQAGATDRAQGYTKEAQMYGALAEQDAKTALAWKAQHEKEIQDAALRHHWSAGERQAALNEVDRLAIAGAHDATTLQAASIHVAGQIQAANINARSRHDAAVYSSGEAWKRTKYVQGQENKRQLTGIHYRDKLEQRAAKRKAASGKFRTLDLPTRAMMVRQMKQAIDSGADEKQVFAHAATLHGIPPEEVEGIYQDMAGGG